MDGDTVEINSSGKGAHVRVTTSIFEYSYIRELHRIHCLARGGVGGGESESSR